MRNMSFSLTTPQIVDRSKTVTRRTGWRFLAPGAYVQAVEKARGLRAGEMKRLAVLRITSVRREPLRRMIDDRTYGEAEVVLEGFGGDPAVGTPERWVEYFASTHDCTVDDDITRIEFEYVTPPTAPAG